MKQIGLLTLSDDEKELLKCDTTATEVVIPDSVTSIGYLAFYNCISLTSIIIPDSVTSICSGAFLGCSKLKTVVIPDSVKYIDEYAFAKCTSLTSIKIPDSVTSISNGIFCDCTKLTSVLIPESVTYIGNSAFQNCHKLYSKLAQEGSMCYKAMKPDLTCRGYQYEIGKTYIEPMAQCCKCGFHACTKLTDVFNYYSGKYGENFVIAECTHSGKISENGNDSKFACTELTVDRVLTREEVLERLNN